MHPQPVEGETQVRQQCRPRHGSASNLSPTDSCSSVCVTACMSLHARKASRSMIERLVKTLCHAVWHMVAVGCAETHGCCLVGHQDGEMIVVGLNCRFGINDCFAATQGHDVNYRRLKQTPPHRQKLSSAYQDCVEIGIPRCLARGVV